MESERNNQDSIAKVEQEVPTYNPAWLGGIFEAGGTIEFRITSYPYKDRRLWFATPTLVINDNDQDRIQKLQDVVGGKVYAIKNANFRWMLAGRKAIDHIFNLKRYAPSRQEVIVALENWEQANSEEKVEIARGLQGHQRAESVSQEDYLELVKNLAFVAGVVDARGFLKHEARIRATPAFRYISVRTTNTALLYALQKQYGGKIRENNEFKNADNYHIWELDAQQSRNVLSLIAPYLVLRQTESQTDQKPVSE